MAKSKFDSIIIGAGNIKENINSSVEVFAGASDPDPALGKDGDYYCKASGVSSDLLIKKGGIWVSAIGMPLTSSLVDGQATPALAFEFPVASFPYAKIEYTVRRGGGHGYKRQGVISILSTTSGQVQWNEENLEIGPDVSVEFSFQVVGSNLQVMYTSTSLGTPIELKYALKGWV